MSTTRTTSQLECSRACFIDRFVEESNHSPTMPPPMPIERLVRSCWRAGAVRCSRDSVGAALSSTRVCSREQGELAAREESVSPSLSTASGNEAGWRRGGRTYVLLHHSGDRCDGHLGRCCGSAWRTTRRFARSLARVEAAATRRRGNHSYTADHPLRSLYATLVTALSVRIGSEPMRSLVASAHYAALIGRPFAVRLYPDNAMLSPSLRRCSCVLEQVRLPTAT